jgi:hypothetical protein
MRLVLLILSVSLCAAAQDADQQQTTAPAPAFGQSAPVLNPENPPLSGVGEPGLSLKTASRSFISPAIQVGESADTNENDQLGSSKWNPVSHVLGALDVQKFWTKSDLFLEYLGGGAFQVQPTYAAQQLQAVGFEAVTRWRTGYLEVRDGFSYLPQGIFELGATEGLPGLGLATGGLGTGEAGGGLPGLHTFGFGTFEGIGNVPRLSNTAVADVVEALSPRSAITFAGAFSNAHFYNDQTVLINSDQTTFEGGYTRLLSRHDQLAAVYAFQIFRFPYTSGGEIFNHVLNLRWSHTITGKLQLIVGGGPEYSDLEYGGSFPSWYFNGRATMRYRFEHSALSVSWEKYESQGEGLFAGADTQLVRGTYQRPLGRTNSLYAYVGYVRENRLQSPLGFDYTFGSFDSWLAGVILRKHVGRAYDLFAAYSFNQTQFDVPVEVQGCIGTIGCGSQARRQIFTVGVEWHPKAVRVE